MTIADRINHLVDVYPQGVGTRVDNFAAHVNDTDQPSRVHLDKTNLWLNSSANPQAQGLSVLGCRWLSPQSTDPMTNDVLSYFRMANCTSTSRATSVDNRPMKIEENR